MVIDGLNIPKLTWQWLGLAVASGIATGLAGALVGELVNAIFGDSGPSLQEIMRTELDRFARRIEAKIDDAQLKALQGEVNGYFQLFSEYGVDPTDARFDFLINNTAVVLGKLEALGFPAYSTYMVAGGLRLAILQEYFRRSSSAERLFAAQYRSLDDYNVQMQIYIGSQCQPASIGRIT